MIFARRESGAGFLSASKRQAKKKSPARSLAMFLFLAFAQYYKTPEAAKQDVKMNGSGMVPPSLERLYM